MSWDDPFKPVDWSAKSKSDSNDFFKPVDPYPSSWGAGNSSGSNSWAFSTGQSPSASGWSSPSQSSVFAPVSTQTPSGWGYSASDSVNATRSWAFSTGSPAQSNQNSSFGFGASGFSIDHHIDRLREAENKSAWNQDIWHVSDQNWHWGNVSGKNERDALLRHLEDKGSSDLFRPTSFTSSWSSSSTGSPSGSDSGASWHFSGPSNKSESSWAFSGSSSDNSSSWHWSASSPKSEGSWAFSGSSPFSSPSSSSGSGNDSNSVFQPVPSLLKRW